MRSRSTRLVNQPRRAGSGQRQPLSGADRRPGQVVARLKLPHALARVARVARRGDRPERVTGLDHVDLSAACPVHGVREKAPPEKRGQEDDQTKTTEHVFAMVRRTRVRVKSAVTRRQRETGGRHTSPCELRPSPPPPSPRRRSTRASTASSGTGSPCPSLRPASRATSAPRRAYEPSAGTWRSAPGAWAPPSRAASHGRARPCSWCPLPNRPRSSRTCCGRSACAYRRES